MLASLNRQQTPKPVSNFVNLMLGDERRLSLVILMHLKCIYEIFSLFINIPTC
jgi:hypothetical protein